MELVIELVLRAVRPELKLPGSRTWDEQGSDMRTQ
jgi:hypothetical protein